MKSYIQIFDWNNGEELDPFSWLWEEDKSKNKKIKRSIRIKKG